MRLAPFLATTAAIQLIQQCSRHPLARGAVGKIGETVRSPVFHHAVCARRYGSVAEKGLELGFGRTDLSDEGILARWVGPAKSALGCCSNRSPYESRGDG